MELKCAGVGGSGITRFGDLPKLGKDGFFIKFHSTANCNDTKNVIDFFNTKVCENGRYVSTTYEYNHEKKQAELSFYSLKDCQGFPTSTQVLPVGECVRFGKEYVKVEKSE
jgi:hypothetical protein